MHLFLIRHGETEHNIAGLLAGVTDSRLTNHGVLQTQKLGTSLIKDRGLRFTNVYSSDLQRAFMTANEICKVQNNVEEPSHPVEVVKLELLREQDFGSLELVAWTSRRAEEGSEHRGPDAGDQDFKAKETVESMKLRANMFLDDYIVPLIPLEQEQTTRVAIVSHGLFLAHLWRTLLSRFSPKNITIDPSIAVTIPNQILEHTAWTNTGCLEVDICFTSSESVNPIPKQIDDQNQGRTTSSFGNATMLIISVNDKRHLLNLKRARGGIGSAAFDKRQLNLNSFFKKSKIEPAAKHIASKGSRPKSGII